MYNPKAIINLPNIKHNIIQIKNYAKLAKILAVIKADAYGHGAVAVAQYLDTDRNVSGFGVSRLSEALTIKQHNITKPILLLEGVLNLEQLQIAAQHGFWLVVHSLEQLELLNKINNNITIWLKFNTGMNRLGIDIDNIEPVCNLIKHLINSKHINHNLVIMSHLACADNLSDIHNKEQIDKFAFLIQEVNKKFNQLHINTTTEYSLANSAGIFALPDSHYDWVRPGISLYGGSPLLDKTANNLNLKPTMELLALVISIKIVNKDSYIGYGAEWICPLDTVVAIINCGYADGYPRVTDSNSYVWVNNVKCRILGRVSMDMMAIDCSNLYRQNKIKVGDIVELWGYNITIDETAKACHTISYDLYTKITSRVTKNYINY